MAEPLTVIGAGPVGSLLALFLARRGHEVRVFERRPDMRRVRIGAGRSINLAVSTRGLYALHQVGLDGEVLRQAIPMYGRMVHAAGSDPRFLRYGRDDTEFINSMSRGELNELLMTEAERTGRVRIEFQQRLVGYAGGRARLRDERSGEEREVLAPVIFGSDGSASALRGSLPIEVEQSWLDFGYKELTLPPSPGGGFSLEKNALHIWPRKNFMLIALPNLDGSFTCTLFLPFEGPASFAAIEEPAAAERFFAETFPDALALIPGLGEALAKAPLGRMVTVKCSPWSRGQAVLIGDAAHAIVPFFGQGMNAGFEDCTVLMEILDRVPDWSVAFAELSRARKPDADAIADLAVENFVEMRDKVADPDFLLWKEVEAELSRRFPGEYLSRYQLVTFTRIPYRIAQEAGRLQTSLLRELTLTARSASSVDYSLAHSLIRSRLLPLLEPYGLGSSAG
ncbi:MAG TPA: NAD(P)/FAD-dependent oxidoreductase [Myxococcales bacterium]|nr:NAD(P)/FAD-dependent oxidoreductase [Myxococcales bacterium]